MKLLIAVLAAAALAAVPAALADDALTLHPSGHGAHTYVAWNAFEGLPDHWGEARQALYFEREAASPAADAVAVVEGVAGLRADLFKSLRYDSRNDSRCTVTDPRWALFVRGRSGRGYLLNFGCRASAQRPIARNWTRRDNIGTAIRARLLATGGHDAARGVVTRLVLVFDRAVGRAWLDNVAVDHVQARREWSFAGDNGVGPIAPPAALTDAERAALDAEPTALDLMTEEEVWASLTDEERALAEQEPDPAVEPL